MTSGNKIDTGGTASLSHTVNTQATQVEQTGDQLLSACAARGEFTGNMESAYTDFLAKWRRAQAAMVEAMRAAATVLAQTADGVDTQMTQAANVLSGS